MYVCPQCLPSDIVPIRSWTRTLRPLGTYPSQTSTIPYHTTLVDAEHRQQQQPMWLAHAHSEHCTKRASHITIVFLYLYLLVLLFVTTNYQHM